MIETHDLSKQFNDFWAVDGVTLKVHEGQILAILGQNGAGKTTTVRMLTALLAPTRGWARVAGYDVTTHGRELRAAIGVLTEQHGLYMRMSAEEYLHFFGEVYNLDLNARKERTQYLLEYFGLEGVARQRIGEYSKGMRQKLALARAMMHEPPVLLLDEPTSAMDPESARLVRNEIARLRSSKRAIIMCTHNLVEAETLADQVAIIYRGRVLKQGTLNGLKHAVLGFSQYEAVLSQPWQGSGLNLPQGVTLLDRTATSLKFQVEAPHESNPHLMRELTSKSMNVVAFQESPRTLEQVYLNVMAEARGCLNAE
ncbi:MAG: ABC transporter ATP-binding protein [Anaerolineales bacterium]|nr:ABC transporter ATP-binding protein [Anaerolineales bacterium]